MTLHSAALEAEPLRYNKNSNALSTETHKKPLQATVAAIPNTTTVMESVFRSIFRRSCMLSLACCQKLMSPKKAGEPQAGWDRGLGLQAEGVDGGPCLIGLFVSNRRSKLKRTFDSRQEASAKMSSVLPKVSQFAAVECAA